MKVVYIHRNQEAGFSIQKVFNTISMNLDSEVEVSNVYLPHFGSSPLKIIKNLYFIHKLRNKGVIYHVTGDIHYVILALLGLKTVLTVHDLVYLKNAKNVVDFYIKKIFWVILPVKLASKVTCISENTKNDLSKYVQRHDIRVIYNPISNSFEHNNKNFNEQNPVILHIGTGWNKNLSNVIIALAGIRCKLRIIGKLDNKTISLLEEHKISYTSTYNVSDNEIIEEYKSADIISFPSVYEGFGMPIIEGQTIGRAVVTSYIEPIIEIAKDSVCYVDPTNITNMRIGFEKVITNSEYRNSVLNKGLINILRFKPVKIANEYYEIYKSFLQ